jgi:hypothetical protein
LPLLLPLSLLFSSPAQPIKTNVISTEAVCAFANSEVEKPPHFVLAVAVAFAFLVVIPEGDLLFCFAFAAASCCLPVAFASRFSGASAPRLGQPRSGHHSAEGGSEARRAKRLNHCLSFCRCFCFSTSPPKNKPQNRGKFSAPQIVYARTTIRPPTHHKLTTNYHPKNTQNRKNPQ